MGRAQILAPGAGEGRLLTVGEPGALVAVA